MPAPKNMHQFQLRFMANQGTEGFGAETASVAPCPFCAAPRFTKWRIAKIIEDMQKDATCSECGRSCKAVILNSDTDPKNITVEFVQTGGPDPEPWHTPKMRRIDE